MKSNLAIVTLVIATGLNLTVGADLVHESLASTVIPKIVAAATTPHPHTHLGKKR